MLCQKCKSKEANTHVKSVVNGEYTEYMLCAECAKQMGYSNLWSDMQSDFDSILGSFFSNALPLEGGDLCLGERAVQGVDLGGADQGTLALGDDLDALGSRVSPLVVLTGQSLHGEDIGAGQVQSFPDIVQLGLGENGLDAVCVYL